MLRAILTAWNHLEADFQRQYRIDLVPWLQEGVSIRRFMVLVGGLDARSVWVAQCQRRGLFTSREEAEAAFAAW